MEIKGITREMPQEAMKIRAFQSETEYKDFEFTTLEEFDYCFLQSMRNARKVDIRDSMITDDMYVLQLFIEKIYYQTILYKSGFGDLWFKWRKIVEEALKENTMKDDVFTNEDNVNNSRELSIYRGNAIISTIHPMEKKDMVFSGMLRLLRNDGRHPIEIEIDTKNLGTILAEMLGLIEYGDELREEYSHKDLGNVKITLEFLE